MDVRTSDCEMLTGALGIVVYTYIVLDLSRKQQDTYWLLITYCMQSCWSLGKMMS